MDNVATYSLLYRVRVKIGRVLITHRIGSLKGLFMPKIITIAQFFYSPTHNRMLIQGTWYDEDDCVLWTCISQEQTETLFLCSTRK